MKKSTIFLVMSVVLSLVSAADAIAQMGQGYRWRGSGGWGMDAPYQRMYDPAKVETMTGRVETVETLVPMRGMHSAVGLLVKTDRETILVHLGPDWYIGRLDTRILKGDTIEVKGSRVVIAGKPALIAAEVKKAGKVLVLRNEAGVPVWAGWRR